MNLSVDGDIIEPEFGGSCVDINWSMNSSFFLFVCSVGRKNDSESHRN